MSSGALTVLPESFIVKLGGEEDIAELTKASNYLPSLRVFDSGSDAVTKKYVEGGDLAIPLGGEKFINLGKETSVLNFGYRPRASIFQGTQKPIDYFDPETEEFLDVQTRALKGAPGYQAGLEYLVWSPEANRFCVFFLGSKSGRRVSDDMKALVGQAATIRSKFVEKGGYSWWCAEILTCSTPFDLPDASECEKSLGMFQEASSQKQIEGRKR
jgi:hypothetical protein